jgi:uncharacterized lipoprotein YmbA
MIKSDSYGAAGFYKVNNFSKSLLNTLFILLLSGLMYGCIGGTSPKSVYYVFTPSQNTPAAQSQLNEYSLGIGPVTIPEFLERPQIITRQGKNILHINEFHRWADSLEAQITDVLVVNLSNLLDTPNVIAYPWIKPFLPKYQLYIKFRRFDGNLADSITMDAIWRLVDTKNKKELLSRRLFQTVPTNNKGYKAYVNALNTAVEQLSQDIAHSILLSP